MLFYLSKKVVIHIATITTGLRMYDQMTGVLRNVTRSLNLTLSAMEDVQRTSNRAFDTRQFEAARRSIQQTELSIRSIDSSIQRNTSEQRRFNAELRNGSNDADSLTRKILSIAGAYIGIRATSRFLLGGSKYFIEFEQQMANVRAITQATDTEFKMLNEEAKKLGRTTVFSATQSAEGMQYLAQAGWTTNQIIAGMPGLLSLAAASGEDLARTTDIISDTMTGFRMAASESNTVADIFAYTASSANTNVAMMGETMKYVAPIAESFGASIQQTSALIGMAANAGIKASQAGTSLRAGFLRMSDPKARAEMALDKLNVSFVDTKGNMKDVQEIVKDLSYAFSKLNNSSQLAAAQRIFGAEAATAWLSIIKQGPEALNEWVESLENADGTAAKMSEIMINTTEGKIKLFMSQIEGVWIDFYDRLSKGTTGEAFSNVLNGLVLALQSILPILEQIIIFTGYVINFMTEHADILGPVIYGLVSALGTWLIMIGLIAVKTAILNAILGTNPLVLIISLVLGVVAALIHAWKTNDKFAAGLMRTWNAILNFFDTIPAYFWSLAEMMVKPFVMWAKTIGKIYDSVINGIIKGINTVLKLVNKVTGSALEIQTKFSFENIATKALDFAGAKKDAAFDRASKKAAEREQKVIDMLNNRASKRAAEQASGGNLGLEKQINDLNGTGIQQLGALNDSNKKLGKISDSVDISKEDLQVMRELAEMKNIQNFVTLTPTVNVEATSTGGGFDIDTMIARITESLENEIASSASATIMV
ncbi:phage tail tape measure protein [Anaerophilus nitritogenes]|uniref:phage tail tape measure protein n=1 Tax=Anaerophilus nitritogenes TaxID=2498136 RepID=UPI0013EAB0AF|nr:phage tail tape measure protein [Anaerophilus nitritogenes]